MIPKPMKDLFVRGPRRAHVMRCKECGLEIWGKTRGHIITSAQSCHNRCHDCGSSLFVPDDIPAIKLEQMYRFLDDEDKIDRLELEHDTMLMEKYGGFGCPCPDCNDGADDENDDGFQYELSDEIRERLK